jgi:hypothetical protein
VLVALSSRSFGSGRWLDRLALSALLSLGALACGQETQDLPPGAENGPIEIAGTWISMFAPEEPEVISTTRWGSAEVVEFENLANWVVLRNPDDAMFQPGKFNRVTWTEPANDRFYYCWVVIGVDSALAAKTSTGTADATSPDTRGCGDFPWTRLERQR